MDPSNPKLLFLIKLDKNKLTRLNLRLGTYDNSKSNLIFGKISIKSFVILTCIVNIILNLGFFIVINSIKIDNQYDIYENISSFTIIRDIFIIAFHIVSFALLLLSALFLNETYAKFGIFIYQIQIICHIFLLLIYLYYYIFYNEHTIFIYSIQNHFFLAVLIFYIFFEIGFLYVCFQLTYNLILGNDAYICGEFFNKYVENLASSVSNFSINTPSKKSYNINNDDSFN